MARFVRHLLDPARVDQEPGPDGVHDESAPGVRVMGRDSLLSEEKPNVLPRVLARGQLSNGLHPVRHEVPSLFSHGLYGVVTSLHPIKEVQLLAQAR